MRVFKVGVSLAENCSAGSLRFQKKSRLEVPFPRRRDMRLACFVAEKIGGAALRYAASATTPRRAFRASEESSGCSQDDLHHCRRAVCRSSNLLNIAEQPARLGLGDGALLTEWKSAYKRGVAMQAPLALVGSLLKSMAHSPIAGSVGLLFIG